jgi:hypothetical protein
MEEQQDKDFYHYEYNLENTHEWTKYIKQLQEKPKSESMLKKPRRSKDRKKSKIKRKLEKNL